MAEAAAERKQSYSLLSPAEIQAAIQTNDGAKGKKIRQTFFSNFDPSTLAYEVRERADLLNAWDHPLLLFLVTYPTDQNESEYPALRRRKDAGAGNSSPEDPTPWIEKAKEVLLTEEGGTLEERCATLRAHFNMRDIPPGTAMVCQKLKEYIIQTIKLIMNNALNALSKMEEDTNKYAVASDSALNTDTLRYYVFNDSTLMKKIKEVETTFPSRIMDQYFSKAIRVGLANQPKDDGPYFNYSDPTISLHLLSAYDISFRSYNTYLVKKNVEKGGDSILANFAFLVTKDSLVKKADYPDGILRSILVDRSTLPAPPPDVASVPLKIGMVDVALMFSNVFPMGKQANQQRMQQWVNMFTPLQTEGDGSCGIHSMLLASFPGYQALYGESEDRRRVGNIIRRSWVYALEHAARNYKNDQGLVSKTLEDEFAIVNMQLNAAFNRESMVDIEKKKFYDTTIEYLEEEDFRNLFTKFRIQCIVLTAQADPSNNSMYSLLYNIPGLRSGEGRLYPQPESFIVCFNQGNTHWTAGGARVDSQTPGAFPIFEQGGGSKRDVLNVLKNTGKLDNSTDLDGIRGAIQSGAAGMGTLDTQLVSLGFSTITTSNIETAKANLQTEKGAPSAAADSVGLFNALYRASTPEEYKVHEAAITHLQPSLPHVKTSFSFDEFSTSFAPLALESEQKNRFAMFLHIVIEFLKPISAIPPSFYICLKKQSEFLTEDHFHFIRALLLTIPNDAVIGAGESTPAIPAPYCISGEDHIKILKLKMHPEFLDLAKEIGDKVDAFAVARNFDKVSEYVVSKEKEVTDTPFLKHCTHLLHFDRTLNCLLYALEKKKQADAEKERVSAGGEAYLYGRIKEITDEITKFRAKLVELKEQAETDVINARKWELEYAFIKPYSTYIQFPFQYGITNIGKYLEYYTKQQRDATVYLEKRETEYTAVIEAYGGEIDLALPDMHPVFEGSASIEAILGPAVPLPEGTPLVVAVLSVLRYALAVALDGAKPPLKEFIGGKKMHQWTPVADEVREYAAIPYPPSSAGGGGEKPVVKVKQRRRKTVRRRRTHKNDAR